MQIIPGHFTGQTVTNGLSEPDTYVIDENGIKAGEYSSLLVWSAIVSIEAWITTCEDYDGWGRAFHLRLHSQNRQVLQTSDLREVYFYTDLKAAIAHYLGVSIDWYSGEIEADYQRRRRWHRGWLAHSKRPVVYTQRA